MCSHFDVVRVGLRNRRVTPVLDSIICRRSVCNVTSVSKYKNLLAVAATFRADVIALHICRYCVVRYVIHHYISGDTYCQYDKMVKERDCNKNSTSVTVEGYPLLPLGTVFNRGGFSDCSLS